VQLDLFELQEGNGDIPNDIQGLRAKSLAEIGNYPEAIKALQKLLEKQSNSISIRTELARAFEQSQQPNEALDEWRKLAANSKPATDPWFNAKYGIAKNLLAVKKPNEAADVIRVTRALHPELGGSELKRLFESLLRLCDADATHS
jgi:tetratricopeptide (TPR) repeat protein